MYKLIRDVTEFHLAFGHPVEYAPTIQTPTAVNRRADWLIEEANELKEATTLQAQVDAYIDSIYFAVGGLVELGIDPDPIWDLVHGANMAKVWEDGTVHKTEVGKVIKPEGWTAPDEAILAELRKQARGKI